MTELEADHTHLFPGACGRVLSGDGRDGPALVNFADGSRASGVIEGGRLALGSYRTAAGTDVPARNWRFDIGGKTFRIASRA